MSERVIEWGLVAVMCMAAAGLVLAMLVLIFGWPQSNTCTFEAWEDGSAVIECSNGTTVVRDAESREWSEQ